MAIAFICFLIDKVKIYELAHFFQGMVRPNPLINVNAIMKQASLWPLLLSHHGHKLLSSEFNIAALYHYLLRWNTYLGNSPCRPDPFVFALPVRVKTMRTGRHIARSGHPTHSSR